MRLHPSFSTIATAAVLSFAFIVGCKEESSTSKTAPAAPAGQGPAEAARPAAKPLIPTVAMIDWCPEHGVPESICTRCNDSLTAGFKAKNDWCAEHSLPDSQCFKHHPELQQKFATAYKEQHGKEPPAIEKH